MPRQPKTKLFAFQINFIFKFTLIVQTLECDARRDAYNVLDVLHGRSATIKGEGKAIKVLPENACAVRYCNWAWIIE